MDSISFIVPCFNEEENVESTVISIHEAMASATDVKYEIILIDDCSKDKTLTRMQSLAQSDACVRIIHNEINLNIGGSYKRGVDAAQHTYAILVPGDNAFGAASIAHILNYRGRADIVIPEVINSDIRTPFRGYASKCFTNILNWIFRLDVRYYNGAVLHRTDLLRTIEITTNGFAYQAEAIVKLILREASYVQCQVQIQERLVGKSSALKAKNLITVSVTILRLLHEVWWRHWFLQSLRRSKQNKLP